jgi:putative glutamine amidotransferase
MMTRTRPRILVPADVKDIGGHPFHAVGDKYLAAIRDASDALPLLVPAFGDWLDFQDLITEADGIFLTGSLSNVEPARYGGSGNNCAPYDPARDGTTLPLITESIKAGLPLFAVCRGFQELNVALGGTLLERVHETPGRFDHRSRDHLPIEQQYEPVHPIRLTPGGLFHRLAGAEDEIQVNSLHGQGIEVPSDRLIIEAVAPDGTIEGVSVRDAKAFAIAVQWHPEWRVMGNPFSVALFKAFGDAARARQALRKPT